MKLTSGGIFLKMILPLLTICYSTAFSQQYGLGFHGNEKNSDLRTSLILGDKKKISISNDFEIDFKAKTDSHDNNFYGYIFRLIDTDDNNIDLIFRSNTFQFIIGQQNFDLSDKSKTPIETKKWNNLKLKVDLISSEVCFYVNEVLLVKTKSTSKFAKDFTLYFGQSHHPGFSYKDVAAMTIKDIKISSEEKLKHHWSLDQISGSIVTDTKGNLNGKVLNPKWVKRKNYTWELVLDNNFDGVITTSYNSPENQLHIFSEFNHFSYNLEENSSNIETYKGAIPKITFGDAGVSFKDKNGFVRVNKHQFFPYNPKERNFLPKVSEPDTLTEFWHHNTYIYPEDTAIVTIGGYGMFKYKNSFQKFSLLTGVWENLNMSGDIPAPRYLAGFGNSKDATTSYYIGGYGSDSGDQLITPKNYYDFYKIDWINNEVSKVYTLPEPKEPYVFANNLILQESKDLFWGITFNQLKHNSELQLVQGSLEKPELTNIGDKLPFLFNDVRSTVNLYFNELDKKLFLVLTLHDINISRTNVKVYQISAPEDKETEATFSLIYLIPLCLIGLLVFLRIYLRRRNKVGQLLDIQSGSVEIKPVKQKESPASEQKSSVILFGEFQIINQNGKDFTRAVSPLLKEIFVYILMHTLRWNKGVSTSKLDEMFWYDKSKASARNNRAVNIRKLKSILEEVDGISLAKKTGNLEIEYDENLACIDYAKFLKIALFESENSKDQIDQLSKIVQRGTLLPNQDFEWLDSFKSETSNKIIDKYLLFAETLTLSKENAKEQIDIANNIFLFDPLDEIAMSLKCRAQHILGKHTLAKETYEKFVTNYESLFNEKFGKTYQQILEE
ncbi:hypothetical protein [uncultured Arcticibacterium sp.]|uniref:hypothetical protein n=1 Tax=uncultured Arcticibacterium sp. TaxID=2173042 RepID=UPI0030FB8FD7